VHDDVLFLCSKNGFLVGCGGAAFLGRQEAGAHLDAVGSRPHKPHDVIMGIDSAGDDDGKISEFDRHVFYRRQKVLKLIGFQVHLVDPETQMAASGPSSTTASGR
jgi:hypothetical protein